MPYRLLTAFENLFRGKPYRHRASNQGDFIALQLYEDLSDLGKAAKFLDRVSSQEVVVNQRNERRGIQARRGDGTLGERIPGQVAVSFPGYSVSRGPVATVEIGTEVKILAKAMIKQIDRVIGDLQKQVTHFNKGGGAPICIGIVGVNHAPYAVGYEGDRAYRTDGKGNRHPIQEAAETISRLRAQAAPHFSEFLILGYEATNDDPYDFRWVDYEGTVADYAAALTRISREYDRRF